MNSLFRVTVGTKLLITLALVALLPAAFSAWLAIGALGRVGDIANWESTNALEGQARDRVRLLALEMARREDLVRVVAETRVGDRGYAFVVDNAGQLVAAPSDRLAELGVTEASAAAGVNLYQVGPPTLRAALTETLSVGSGLREVTLAGEARYLAYARLPRTDWTLVLVLPVADILQPVVEATERIDAARTDLLTQLALGVAGLIVAVIAVASVAYRALVAPIRRLTDGTRLIAAGDLGHRLSVTSGDEIGELATEFNVMAGRLQELTLGLERKVAERTRELERRTREAVTLHEISRALGSTLELHQVLRQIVVETSRLLDVQRVAIFLHHPATDTLYARATYVAAADRVEQVGRREAMSLPAAAVPLWQELATTLQPILIEDAASDARAAPPDWIAGADVQTLLEVPLVVGGRANGFISIGAVEQRRFAEPEVLLAQSLAQHAAMAIENARLYRRELRRADQFRTLNELGRRIGVLHSLDELLPYTVRLLRETFHYQRVQIFVVEGDWLVFRAGAYEGNQTPLEGVRLRVGEQGIIGWVARSGEPLLANDVGQEPRYLRAEALADTRAELAVPIALGERVLGVLDVESDRVHAFEPADLITAQAVADQIALALENVRLIEAERRGRQETALVLEMTRAVGASLQLDRVLQIAAQGIASAVGARNCGIYLLDEDLDALMPRAGAGRPPSPEVERAYVSTPIRPDSDPFLRQVFAERRPLASDDARHDSRLSGDLVERLRLGGILAVPFVVREKVVGLAVVTWFDEPHEFTSEQVALAEGIANSVALAIENARLYERTHDLAVVEERNRLAREIHDTLAQSLTGIVLQLEAADQLFESKPERARARLEKATELARASIQEARRSVWNLRPAPLEEMSLAEAVQGEVHHFGAETGLEVGVCVDGDEGTLPPETEHGLFRILQESLNNIRKHARARRVAVDLAFGDDEVRLAIRDDGVGFDDEAPPERPLGTGFGLLGMRERARLLGGELEIESAPGRGTVLSVVVPRSRDPVRSAARG